MISGKDYVSLSFAMSIARSLGLENRVVDEKTFPDGEIYVRLPSEIKDEKEVILVQSFIPPQDTSILKTLLMLDTLKEKGLRKILLVVPYLAYSRQDREFLPNEAVSIRTLMRTLRLLGATCLITVEIHKEDSLKYFGEDAVSVSPYAFMVKRIELPPDPLVLAPDMGALKRAVELAKSINTDYDYLVKERNKITGEITIKPKSLDVKDRDVIIVDDIISTGGTVAKASEILLSQGAKSVTVIIAHALMVGNAIEKLKKAGVKRVYACNTLPKVDDDLIEYIDVAPLVAEELKRWM